jgi:Pvc16 N-terminal domain
MSASTAIGMVSTSLRNLLSREMQLNPAVEVTILSPDEPGSSRRVNLFLFRVEENQFLANQDFFAAPGNHLVPPPVSLNLYYLLTVYAQNDTALGNVPAHEILGEAMRVFRQNSPVPRDQLAAGLRDAREQLQIVCKKPDPEELSRIWATFGKPYRLSVLYEVSCVQLDLLSAATPVPTRVRQVGTPGVRGDVSPPSIDTLAPVRGAAGTPVEFTGSNLTGRPVTVTLGDAVLVAITDATGDTVSAGIPSDLSAGTYELRVDVSTDFRRVFLFEVVS